jgi:hypothetical protein
MVTFDPAKLIETIERVVGQIRSEFPKADLLAVGESVTELARRAETRSAAIKASSVPLRIAIVLILAFGLAGSWFVIQKIRRFPDAGELFTFFQGLEAVLNVVILAGVALFSIVTVESRWQRSAVLKEINAIVSLVHVIDMHQLGKRPMLVEARSAGKDHALPAGSYTPDEIMRYFDLCSDLMSLAAKIALIYEEVLPDSAVSDAVTDAAQLATALSNETYQKMMLMDRR